MNAIDSSYSTRARVEFETFAKSLVMNYRRVAAKAEPPRARCLEIALAPGECAVLDGLVPSGAAAGQSWPEGSVGARVGTMG